MERSQDGLVLRGVLGKGAFCLHFEELERALLRVKLEDNWCGTLIYADDIVLVADSRMELQTML